MKPLRPAPPSAAPTHPHDLAHPTTPAAPARLPITPLHTLAQPHPSVAAGTSLHAPLAPVLGASLPTQQAAAAGSQAAAPAPPQQLWIQDGSGAWRQGLTFSTMPEAQTYLAVAGYPAGQQVLPVGVYP